MYSQMTPAWLFLAALSRGMLAHVMTMIVNNERKRFMWIIPSWR
jgi:hypothetical protein